MFKTILVHLSGTQTDDATLSTAYQIARLFDGHMVCLRVRPDTSAMLGQAAGAAMAPSVAVAEMLEMLRRKDAEQTEKARRSFDRFVEREDVAGGEVGDRQLVLVGDEAVEAGGAQLACARGQKRALGFREERSGQVDHHGRASRRIEGLPLMSSPGGRLAWLHVTGTGGRRGRSTGSAW